MGLEERKLSMVVSEGEGSIRLDVYVATHTDLISRSTLSDKDTIILLNGKHQKKSKLVKQGDEITIIYQETCFSGITGEDIPLKVLYEDEDMLLIDKEQGMVVHPGHGNMEHTLVNALVYRYGNQFCDSLQEVEDEEDAFDLGSPAVRPGIVHRLDKDTSGVLVIARNRIAHRELSAQFKNRSTRKTYIALVKGVFSKKQGIMENHLKRDPKDRKKFTTCGDTEGRSAKTEWEVLKQFPRFALVRITLHTGRTHQIRVHMSKAGHPIIGDVIYGKEDGTTLMLHAMLLEVESPSTGKRIRCRAPMPERFITYIKATRPLSSSAARSQSSPTARGRG